MAPGPSLAYAVKVQENAASAPSGSLNEMQTPRPCPRPTEWDSLQEEQAQEASW